MIDRNALRITGLILFVMIAAGFWRLSLLPDWTHMPVMGPRGPRTVSGLFIFIPSGCLLFVAAFLFVRKWLFSGPADAVKSWQRWSGFLLIAYCAICALLQAFMIAGSLHLIQIPRMIIARAVWVLAGLLIIVLGNAIPKLPWLSSQFRLLQLDPWQWARHLRLMGKVLVGMGAFVVIGGLLLSPTMFFAFIVCLWFAGLAASLWYRAKLRHEPSP